MLLEHALPPGEKQLRTAATMVRKMAILPLASERAESASIIANSIEELDAVIAGLADAKLPEGPIERVLGVVEKFCYSRTTGDDALSATAQTPCWAINLAACARPEMFRLSSPPLPCPGLVQRRLFRADLPLIDRCARTAACLDEALHHTLCDLSRMIRAADIFARNFPTQRSHSRLFPAWMLLFTFGSLSPAQLARALNATKAGAGILLRQLSEGNMARSAGPFSPFLCTIKIPAPFTKSIGWGTESNDRCHSQIESSAPKN